jgi:hypothetical protein
MHVRFVLPVAAIGLALIAPSYQLAAQGSQVTQIRPAQVTETGQCDDLLQRVEARMSTALALNVRSASADLRQAQELCDSGQPEQGIPVLMGVLGYMNDNETSARR